MIYRQQFSSEQDENIDQAKDALERLRANPTDAVAVMALYEACGRELEEIAVRHFGKTQLADKAVLNLLVAVVSRARTCDPQITQAREWILQCAEAEARKLRAGLDATCSRIR